MCGILGFWHKNQLVDRKVFEKALISLFHRGPDGRGIFIDTENNLALGHVRLSIIDLSEAASQPMFNESKTLVIVYNGEIYNYQAIRKELQKKGYNFRSHSDTEVILKGYEAWGEDVFEKLNGMYALAIWDRSQRKLILARDPFGIKPLYYYFDGKTLIFSSEVKIFRFLSEYFPYMENPDWKIYFLTFGFIPNPYTTVKGVYALKKGHTLILYLDKNRIEAKKFFEITFSDKERDLEKLRSTFISAVKRHLIADVPVGVFLSGGIDSSLVALLACKLTTDCHTISIIFKEKNFSEEKYQRLVLQKIVSSHHERLVTREEFEEHLDRVLKFMDQPTIDGINTYFVSLKAKEIGLKTVMSGLGGDELFYGYPSFRIVDKLVKFKYFHTLSTLARFLPSHRWKKASFLRYFSPVYLYLFFRGLFIPEEVGKILQVSPKYVWEKIFEVDIKLDKDLEKYPRKYLSYLEMEYYLTGQLLKDSDFMGMANSIEIRVPFLDKELVELAFKFDDKVKFNPEQPKYLITKTFEDLLPQEIVFRKKQGFTFPFKIWLQEMGEVKNYVKRYGWSRGWGMYLFKNWEGICYEK